METITNRTVLFGLIYLEQQSSQNQAVWAVVQSVIWMYEYSKNYEKNNAWNIRRLVNESFVPATQQTSVLYCRLSDFSTIIIAILLERPFISFGLRHHCLEADLQFSAVKRHGTFLMRMNGLRIFSFLCDFFPINTFFSNLLHIPLSWNKEMHVLKPNFLSSQMASHSFSPSSLPLHKGKKVQLNGKTL